MAPDGLQPSLAPYLIPFPWLVLQPDDLPLTNRPQYQWQAVLPRSAWLLILAFCPAVSGPRPPALALMQPVPVLVLLLRGPWSKNLKEGSGQKSETKRSCLSNRLWGALPWPQGSQQTYREPAPAGSLTPACLRKPSSEPIQPWSSRNAYCLALIKCWVICYTTNRLMWCNRYICECIRAVYSF